MKTCNSCLIEKPLVDFGKCSKNKDGRLGKCKECKRLYDNQFHKNRNSESKLKKQELQRNREKENRQYVYDYLKNNPCVVCEEYDPTVLEFDHIDRDSKLKAVSNMRYFSIDKIKEEISKCRVLCANCHRRHTAGQLGWYSDLN